MPAPIDLKGKAFGRLVVLRKLDERKNGEILWLCKCDCGNTTKVRGYYLRTGHTTSCGCYHQEQVRRGITKHNGTGTPEYRVWASMIQRCEDQNCASYRDYGARGISVCPEWRNSFPQFLQDMGPKPSAKHEIDRIDNDGNYEPGNCRWATRKEQAANRRSTHRVTLHGVTKSLKDWCDTLGLDYRMVHRRVNSLGWTYEQALNTPKGERLGKRASL